jgi:hypothetical protein
MIWTFVILLFISVEEHLTQIVPVMKTVRLAHHQTTVANRIPTYGRGNLPRSPWNKFSY